MEVTEELYGHVEMSNEAYHASPGVSKSHLDEIAAKSPLHYWHKYLNTEREPEEPSDALKLGTAIHSAILEPDLFQSSFVVSPAFNMRTKEGKQLFAEFSAENQGKSIITPDDHKTCLAIRDRAHTNPTIAGLLTGGRSEQTFFSKDAETGELVKCRYDYLHDDWQFAIDVKSTRDASKASFRKDVSNFRYDIAVPWYFDVLKNLTGQTPKYWVWLAFEKVPPYAMAIYTISPTDIELARQTAREDFLKIVRQRRAQEWPDYAESVEVLDMPPWSKRGATV